MLHKAREIDERHHIRDHVMAGVTLGVTSVVANGVRLHSYISLRK